MKQRSIAVEDLGFPEGVSVLTLDAGSEPGPVIATAIHDGHALPDDFAARTALSAAHRRREEDPYTADMIAGCPWQIVVHRSRFATDLNRARAESVYLTPEMAWGLQLWQEPPGESTLQAAWLWHDQFYAAMERLLDRVARRHRRFVVLDVHSYNHRRGGPDQPPTSAEKAPDINIGTSSLPPGRWEDELAIVRQAFRSPPGLQVADNVAFQGRGELTRFVHQRYPEQGGAFAIEAKKFFMDEWTGAPDPAAIEDLRTRFSRTASELQARLTLR